MCAHSLLAGHNLLPCGHRVRFLHSKILFGHKSYVCRICQIRELSFKSTPEVSTSPRKLEHRQSDQLVDEYFEDLKRQVDLIRNLLKMKNTEKKAKPRATFRQMQVTECYIFYEYVEDMKRLVFFLIFVLFVLFLINAL